MNRKYLKLPGCTQILILIMVVFWRCCMLCLYLYIYSDKTVLRQFTERTISQKNKQTNSRTHSYLNSPKPTSPVKNPINHNAPKMQFPEMTIARYDISPKILKPDTDTNLMVHIKSFRRIVFSGKWFFEGVSFRRIIWQLTFLHIVFSGNCRAATDKTYVQWYI